MPIIDLRSDTVTKPSPEMRRAMADAEVGDDVFGDDPTVRALEERAAGLLGKEAGLFVSSGAMGNLVAQLAHVQRGQEVIAGTHGHIMLHEAASYAVVVGASVRPIDEQPDGTLDLQQVREAFRDPMDVHDPITGLVVFENASAHANNQPVGSAYVRALADVAHEGGVPLHIDGARFWNSVVALDEDPRQLAGPADSVTFCLSKGLACPVGSVLVGSKEFIWQARRARKLLGGGMRQVGILAAAGLVALQDGDAGMIDRLADDHSNARYLAEALADIPGIRSPGETAQPEGDRLDPARVRTNFVLFRVERNREAFLDALERRGVLMLSFMPHNGQIRAVTHYGIERSDVDATIQAVREALDELPATAVGASSSARAYAGAVA
ncbi:MAG TPA: GntG family PLP-dependent aldolase [Candidatus Limnocylindrales bacterium]|nr:GntG family PLP-dependent aldolase [Candidatus Limnocylindrales bacterium]